MNQLFRGSIPFGPDIAKLNEALPISALAEGMIVTHDRLREILGHPDKGRYYAVVNSWKALRKKSEGILMRWEKGQGLLVMDPATKLKDTEQHIHQKMRQTGRAVRELGWVNRDRLDEIGRKRLDHHMLVAYEIKNALDAAGKKLAIELAPVKSLPKPQIVKGA